MDSMKKFVDENIDKKLIFNIVLGAAAVGVLAWGLKKTGIGIAKTAADVIK